MIDDPELAQYAEAIAAVESEGSGGYSAIGPRTGNGDFAVGRYQVMASNIPEWTKAALGQAMTPRQFLNNPDAQDAVFAHRFGGYVNQYGNPQDAASAWFTGRPLSAGGNASDGYITGNQYVSRFNAALASQQPRQIDFSSYGVGANGEAPGGNGQNLAGLISKSTPAQPIDFSGYGVTPDQPPAANPGNNNPIVMPNNSAGAPDQKGSSPALGYADEGQNPANIAGFPANPDAVPLNSAGAAPAGSATIAQSPSPAAAEIPTIMNPDKQERPGIEIGPDQWTGTGYGVGMS